MLAHANLLISFWGDALLTTAYVLNRVPSKSVTKKSYEFWCGRKPTSDFWRPWGYMAYVHNLSHKYGKLSLHGKKSIFIRYLETSKCHVFIGEDLDDIVIEFKSCDSTFLENVFPSKREVSTNKRLFEVVPQDDNVIAPEIEEERGMKMLLNLKM
jgi:hypothetical protein